MSLEAVQEFSVNEEIIQIEASGSFFVSSSSSTVFLHQQPFELLSSTPFSVPISTLRLSPYAEEVLVLDQSRSLHSLENPETAMTFPCPDFKFAMDPRLLVGFGEQEVILHDRRDKQGRVWEKQLRAKDCYQDRTERIYVLSDTAQEVFDLRLKEEGPYCRLPLLSNPGPSRLYPTKDHLLAYCPTTHMDVLAWRLSPDLQPLSISPQALAEALATGRPEAYREVDLMPRRVETLASLWPDTVIRGVALWGTEGLFHTDQFGSLFVSFPSTKSSAPTSLLLDDMRFQPARDTEGSEFHTVDSFLRKLLDL